MNSDRWQKLSHLFNEALAIDPEAREAFLAEASGREDPDVVREVRELLEADADADAHLRRKVADTALDLEGDPAGTRIGPYRVVREEGRGGMGRVFLCERDDGEFDQIVAIKVLHSGLAGETLLERFRQERQILARLQHPHIARLLDGGVTEEGRPFFALEYIEGKPIDQYCDEHLLGIDSRLELFKDVCSALTYAHANLVVHRDLKPANILVDDDGQVHLLDFGIAKVLAEDEDAPALTRTAMWAMTPAYASPEQVRGEPVGTATDVYSLGVVFYELLTGVMPYDLDGRSPTAVERAVCATEPDRPSTRVARDAGGTPDSSAVVGANRSLEPAKLRRRLAGDLDVICMKALRKEPEHRYGSVQALHDDIGRHLEGRPVEARPATLGYRLGKAVRRNRWAVGAAAAVVVTSSTLVGFYTVRLAEERDVARVEAAKAREVATFLQGLFEISDPDASLGTTITARELLDRGARRVEEGLDGQPEVQAAMLRVIGEVYGSLGLAQDALPLLRRATEVNRGLYGEDHEEVAMTRLSLASTLQDLGVFDEAGDNFRAAVASFRRAYGPDHPRVSEAVEQLAFWLESDGAYEEAEAQYRAALAQLRSTLSPDDERVVSVVSNLGNLLRQIGRPEEAEPLLREALAQQRRIYGERHTQVASTARTLAALLRDKGHFAESEALYEEVLSIRRELLGESHPEVAATLNSYAILLSRMGNEERAIDVYRRFIAIMEETHDRPHPNLATGYHNLAGSLQTLGRLDEAADHFRRSMAVQDQVFRPGHPNRAFPRVGLASVLRAQSRPELAEPLLREALAIRREALPEGHRYIGEAMSDLGAALLDQGRIEEAEGQLLEAHALLENGEGPEAGRTRTAAARLVRLYESSGDPDRAARYRSTAGN